MTGVVASVGTTHPWNAAGLGIDLQVANSFAVRNLSVVSAVSAQDAQGMHALEAVSTKMLQAQLDALPIKELDVLRIGALSGKSTIQAVGAFVRRHADIPAVVDPVFGATLGGTFLDAAAIAAFRDSLVSVPSVILTPNIEEAQQLLNQGRISRDQIGDAAVALCKGGVHAVLLKGGHLRGDPRDALAVSHKNGSVSVELFEDERLPGTMRGTGCVLAMALACELARGLSLRDAVQSARGFVRSRIVAAAHFAGLTLAY